MIQKYKNQYMFLNKKNFFIIYFHSDNHIYIIIEIHIPAHSPQKNVYSMAIGRFNSYCKFENFGKIIDKTPNILLFYLFRNGYCNWTNCRLQIYPQISLVWHSTKFITPAIKLIYFMLSGL